MSEKNYYDNYWDKNLDGKNLHLPPEWTKDNLRWHYDFFEKYIGSKVLDVGAGEGTFLSYLVSKKENTKIFASELSEKAVSIGKKKNKKIPFRQESIEELSYEDNSFDTIFAIEVMEHLLSIDECLDQINRVLKKRGYFCITTTDFNWPKKIMIASFFWDKFFYPNNPHIRFFTKRTLMEICLKHGFSLVDYKWNRSYFGMMPKGQMIVFRKK